MSDCVRCVKSYWTAGNAEKATKINEIPTHAFLIVRLACCSSIRNFRSSRLRCSPHVQENDDRSGSLRRSGAPARSREGRRSRVTRRGDQEGSGAAAEDQYAAG